MNKQEKKIVLLCEDRPHQSLICEYLRLSGVKNPHREVDSHVASEQFKGSGKQWVLAQFPKLLDQVRKKSQHTLKRMVVMIDADEKTVDEIRQQLRDAEDLEIPPNDRTTLLIPRWHVETWVRCALGEAADEDTRYKSPVQTAIHRREAAAAIRSWAQPNAQIGQSCVPSLVQGLPQWRKLP